MAERRVVMVGMTELLRDLIRRRLDAIEGVELARVLEDGARLVDAVREVRPALVICGSNDAVPPDSLAAVLWAHPGARILSVEGDGRGAGLHELAPRRTELGEPWLELLVSAARGEC